MGIKLNWITYGPFKYKIISFLLFEQAVSKLKGCKSS